MSKKDDMTDEEAYRLAMKTVVSNIREQRRYPRRHQQAVLLMFPFFIALILLIIWLLD